MKTLILLYVLGTLLALAWWCGPWLCMWLMDRYYPDLNPPAVKRPRSYEPVWIGHPRPALSPGWRFITTAQRARDVAVRRVAKKLGVSRKKVREAVAQSG